MSAHQAAAPEPGSAAEAELLDRNGIVREYVAQYRVDGFLYFRLGDALAQVRRGAAGRAEARA